MLAVRSVPTNDLKDTVGSGIFSAMEMLYLDVHLIKPVNPEVLVRLLAGKSPPGAG
jgi:hypothetical protein